MKANFASYAVADHPRSYFVVSTSAVPAGSDTPAHDDRFEPDPGLERLVADIRSEFERRRASYPAAGGRMPPRLPVPVTIRVHGYNTQRADFEREVLNDTAPDGGEESFRTGDSIYIGYAWQSLGLFSRRSLWDTGNAVVRSPAVGWALMILPLVAIALLLWPLQPTGTSASDRALQWLAPHVATLLTPLTSRWIAAILLGCGAILLGLRVSTYLQDRYLAMHYGAPDLGEFLRELDAALNAGAAREEDGPARIRVRLSFVGHSMGSLLLINTLSVLNDYLSNDGDEGIDGLALGAHQTYLFDKLVLCSADIPAIMATPDRNNYFREAMRRFLAVHLFSNDRDIVLKWASLIANWATEPRYDMAGRKLGNVTLVARRGGSNLEPVTRPVMMAHAIGWTGATADAAVPRGRSPRAVRVHFHDCTLDPSLGGTTGFLLSRGLPVALACGVVAFLTRHRDGFEVLWWLAVATIALFAAGMLARALWPVFRDRWIAGPLGMFADWLSLLVFINRRGWNPHSGYFAFGQEPRRRIASILRGRQEFGEHATIRHLTELAPT